MSDRLPMLAACFLVLASLGASVPRRARAQAEAAEVTLEDLLARVASSPRLRAEAALAESYRGEVRQAGLHPNPTLSFEVAGFVGGQETNGGSQQEVRIAMPLLWPHQIDRRVEAARTRLDLARAEVSVLRATLSLEVRRAFVVLLAAQERSAVLAEAESSMERLAAIVRGRAEAGAGRRWDVARIEGELAAVQASRDAAAAVEASAAGLLATLVGEPGWAPRAAGTLQGLALSSVLDEIGEDHPRIEAARAMRFAADARVEMERAFAIPPLELIAGAIFSTAPEGGYLVGGVGMPLPFIDANQGSIERAEREAEAASLFEDAVRIELEARLARARRTVALRRDALRAFDRGVIDRLPLVAQMSEAAYQGGEVSVFEVIDAVRSARELRLARIDHEELLRLAEVELLEAAMGGPPRAALD